MELLTLFYIGAGLLLVAISIPLIQRRIKPNPWYGFRVPKAFHNGVIWYEINAYSGKRLLVVGVLLAVSAVLFALIPNMTVDLYAILLAVLVGIALVFTFIQSFSYLNQIAK